MHSGGQLTGIATKSHVARSVRRRKRTLLKPEPGYRYVPPTRAQKLAAARAGYLNQLGRSSNGYHVMQAVRRLKGSKAKIVREAAARAVARLWKKPIVPPPGVKMTAKDKVESRAKAFLAMHQVGSQYWGQCKKLFLAMEKSASFKDLKTLINSRTLAASPGALRYRLLKRVSQLTDRGALPFLISVAENDKSPTMRKQAKYLIMKRLAQKNLQRFDKKSLAAAIMRKAVAMLRTLSRKSAIPGVRLNATRLLKALTS